MNRRLTKKLIYVIAALAMLALMIPAMAVPVSAAPNTVVVTLVDPTDNTKTTDPDLGYNIKGSIIQLTASSAATWSINPPSGSGIAGFVTPPYVVPANTVWVQGAEGEVVITAHFASGSPTDVSFDKKWGLIKQTDFTSNPEDFTPVNWNEATKKWEATATVTDTVTGTFQPEVGLPVDHAMQGVILHWYLVKANVCVPMDCDEALNLIGAMEDLTAAAAPTHVFFSLPDPTGEVSSYNTTTSGNGASTLTLNASGEEAVQVVVIPEYPGDPQIVVCPEVMPYTFYTVEAEVVPQVRWIGEKIVLEKNFGTTFHPPNVSTFPLYLVRFAQTDPHAILTAIGNTYIPLGGGNFSNTPQSVWTTVDANGFASVMLYDAWEGQINVDCALYAVTGPTNDWTLTEINQHHFTVFYIKLESLTLGDVVGKRDWHDKGLFSTGNTTIPSNPWDPTGSYNNMISDPSQLADMTEQTLNVSQDALLRARVKGWFTNGNPSWRPARYMDPIDSTLDKAANTPGTLLLPAGRWILPDDWAALGGVNWQEGRMHWDIMCDPFGSIRAESPIGAPPDESYENEAKQPSEPIVAGHYVIGPFSPGLELMTPMGWAKDAARGFFDPARLPGMNISTVVPDGNLDMWDAPMPPAKIIFKILPGASTEQAGFFKSAMKTDIYYVLDSDGASLMTGNPPIDSGKDGDYTDPFYMELIPAHEAIPAFNNNNGYDWNSFDTTYGPYPFWQIINSQINGTHPVKAEVYSDNHGEAMIWLNGNWNLDLSAFFYKAGAVDIPLNAQVGKTTVQATADYPYSRVEQAIQSNQDIKIWLWGGLVLGPDESKSNTIDHTINPQNGLPATFNDYRMVLSAGGYVDVSGQTARSEDKMVWVWVTDRDGGQKGVNGAKVTWTLGGNGNVGAIDTSLTGKGISQFNDVTKNIYLDHGFLGSTGGMTTDPLAQSGISYLRPPVWDPAHPTDATKSAEGMLFNKFWGTGGTSAITGLDPGDFCVAAIDVGSLLGLSGHVRVNISITSNDFDEVMGVGPATIEYYTDVDFSVWDYLDDGVTAGDANCDGKVDMGDVIAVERMILGYKGVTSNAIMNTDGTVDMGTVVKIERKILGLQ